MARATLEMFLKLTGADKTSRGLDKVSKTTKQLDSDVKNSTKQNAEFAAGMSSLTKGAIAGAALFAGKQLLDFARSSITAASAAQEAAGAFGTTFGGAAEQLGEQLSKNANLFGLTTSEAKQLINDCIDVIKRRSINESIEQVNEQIKEAEAEGNETRVFELLAKKQEVINLNHK